MNYIKPILMMSIYIILFIYSISNSFAYDPPNGITNVSSNSSNQALVSYSIIEADGYYLNLNNNKNRSDQSSPNNYNKWYNTNISVIKGQTISFDIDGLVAINDSQIFDFDPKIIGNQNTNINFNSGDGIEVTINSKKSDNSIALNYINPGCDIFSYPDCGNCNNCDQTKICAKPPGISKQCNYCDEYGNCTYLGAWDINGSGINIIYGSHIINNPALDFLSQNQINSIGSGSFFSYKDDQTNDIYQGFNVLNLAQSGLLSFSRNYNDHKTNNLGNYSFLIKRTYNKITNANTGSEGFGSIDYAITSVDANNDNSFSASNINSNSAYNITAPNSGTIWFRINQGNFNSNQIIGRYIVTSTVSTLIVNNRVSKYITGITNQLKSEISSATKSMYNLLLTNVFVNFIKALITLYIVIYAVMFTLGMVEITQSDIVVRIFKMGLLFALIATDTSWSFFNNYLFSAFLGGSDYLIAIVTGSNSGNFLTDNNVFAFIDQSVGQFFIKETWVKIGALASNVIGLFLIPMVFYGLFKYILCLIELVLAYLFAFLYLSFTIAIAPLLISCVLFERTKTYFDNWISYLASFTLQPVVLFGSVYFVYNLVMISFERMISYSVSWECVFSISILNINFCLKWFKPISYDSFGGVNNYGGIYINIFISIIVFLIFIKVLESMLDLSSTIVTRILSLFAGPAQISGQGSAARAGIDQIKGLAMGALKIDPQSKNQRANRKKIDAGVDAGINAE